MDRTFLKHLRAQEAGGRKLILVTAADHAQAMRVADHLQLFDEVIASDGTTNLAGSAKAAALVARFGAGNFDYAGSQMADRAVWRQAGKVVLVNADATTVRRIKAECDIANEFAGLPAGPNVYLGALRPHQWLKNALVFIPSGWSPKEARKVDSWVGELRLRAIFCP